MNKQYQAWLWFSLRMAICAAWAALMLYEWNRWPNGSPLLGPLGIAWYFGFDIPLIIVCGLSACALLAYLIKPHLVTAFISTVGFFNWIFWGVMAEGIGC